MPEVDRQVLGFVNHLWAQMMKMTIFLNQKEALFNVLTLTNKRMYLCLHLGSMFFPKFLKCWKLTHIKKSVNIPTAKLKCHEL